MELATVRVPSLYPASESMRHESMRHERLSYCTLGNCNFFEKKFRLHCSYHTSSESSSRQVSNDVRYMRRSLGGPDYTTFFV